MSATVLIVDDSLTVRMELVELLSAAGFRAIPCETIATARAALAARAVDLVVLDVVLPDGDGLELLRSLKEPGAPTARVPVMMLSTEAEVRDRVRAMRTGADEYVGKPYDPAFLVSRARALTWSTPRTASARRTIVLIDDSATFRGHLRDTFEVAGYHALLAASGEEGLRMVSTAAPDAVVVDGQLPGIDGPTVIRRLKADASSRRIPCVLLTASSFDERADELSALEAGADAYVRKTADTALILARVTTLLRRTPTVGLEPEGGPLAPKRILAVDDSRTYLEELAEHLRTEGYDVVLASSGEEALELLAAQPVDAVLLDLGMEGLSGEETCRRVKSSPAWRDIPILVLTARDDAMLEALDAGADDFVAKSDDFEILRARLRAQLRRRQYEEENRRINDELLRREAEVERARASQSAAEARAAESRRLQEQQAELAAFFTLSPELLCICGHDGVLRRVSESWSRALGHPREQLEDRPILELVHPEDQERIRLALEVLAAGGRAEDLEVRLRARDGTYRWLRWWASTDPSRAQVCAAARDVTAQRALEQALREQTEELKVQTEELLTQQTELRQANAALEQASRLKSSFLASMSHELRTPLNAVIGFSELLLEDAAAPLVPAQRRHAEHILTSGRHLLALISDVLDLAKIEAGRLGLRPEAVDPSTAIREALSVVEATASKRRVDLVTRLGRTRPALVDPIRLRQVLLNLLSNALKFSPEGGEVEVGAEDVNGARVRLWVRDHGPGISPALLPRLFEPFVQGDDTLTREHGGTGLGLAISSRLVEEHGGRLDVASTPGQGATFSFTLPASPVATSRVEPPAPARPVFPAALSVVARPTVLVATDQAVAAGRLGAWLDEAGYAVLEARSAEEANVLSAETTAVVVAAGPDGPGGPIGARLVESLAAAGRFVIVLSPPRAESAEAWAGAAEVLVEPVEREALLGRLALRAPPLAAQGGPCVVSIDDDPRVGVLLRASLQERGYELLSAHTGHEGIALVRRRRPALVIVDLTLPDLPGVEVTEALSVDPDTSGVPLVVLSAADIPRATFDRLRPIVQAIAQKGDLSRDGLLALVERAIAAPHRGRVPSPVSTERFAQVAVSGAPERRVLVVDDNDVNRELARTILEGLDLDVFTASSADEAVALVRRLQPALVFMDLAMPGRDGFSAVRELKGDPTTRGVPVVALTALAMRTDEARVKEAGFDGYLTKPIDRRALERVVRVFVDGDPP